MTDPGELSMGELKQIQMKIQTRIEYDVKHGGIPKTGRGLADAIAWLVLHEITKEAGYVDGWHP